jgi:hypothetical protein
VSPVRYELVCYIPEDGIVHSHRRENLKSCDACCMYIKRLSYLPTFATYVK